MSPTIWLDNAKRRHSNNPSERIQLLQMRRILHVHADRDIGIDVLRAGSALYITGFWHLCGYSPALTFYYTPATLFAAQCILGLFVFLSGYLLSRRYRIVKINDLLRFYQRRFLRIWPMYMAALTAYSCIGFIDVRTWIGSAILANMVLDWNLTTLWFASMILTLYVMAPFLMHLSNIWQALGFTLVLYLGLILLHLYTGLIDVRLPQYLPVFAQGIYIGHSQCAQRAMYKRPCMTVSILGLVGSLSIFCQWNAVMARFCAVTLGSLSIAAPALYVGRAASLVVNQKTVRMLSYSSFSMYLLHRVTFHVGTVLCRPTTLKRAVICLWCIILPLTVCISYLFQRTYDTIILDYQRTRRTSGLQDRS